MLISEMLSYLLQYNFYKLSKPERILVEANLFLRIYENFFEIFKKHYGEYFNLIKDVSNKEDEVIENNLLRFLMEDILASKEYTLEGIANSLRVPIDAVVEVASGINANPSLILSAKIIRLHSDIRKDLYSALLRKIVEESIPSGSKSADFT